MAPEQARADLTAVGPGTDVYSLGAILYELLTGRPPFVAETPYDTVLQVVQEEPVPPTQLQRKTPRDLETICLTCLHKAPAQRYRSALDLAEDLRRYLNHEPIRARPTPLARRAAKWARRRPLAAASGFVLLLLTGLAFLGLGAATVAARRAERLEADQRRQEAELRQAAEQERTRAERLSARTLLDLGVSRCEGGELDRGLHLFVRTAELAHTLNDPDLDYAARANLACWRPHYLRPWSELPHNDWVWAVAFSRDGQRVATGGKDRTARVWDALTGAPVTPPLFHPGPVWAVAFSPDGRTLLTGSGDSKGQATCWDAATGKPLGAPLLHEAAVRSVAFSPDGRTFLTHCEESVRLWDTAERRPRRAPLRHDGKVATAAFSPAGDLVVTGGAEGAAKVWRAATGELRHTLTHPGAVLAAAFRADGLVLLTGCIYPSKAPDNSAMGGAQLWDVSAGKAIGPRLNHQGAVRAVAFSPDGTRAATAGLISATLAQRQPRGESRLWRADPGDPAVGKQLAHLEHPGPVWSIAFSPTGKTILTGCEDHHARLWNAGDGQLVAASARLEGNVRQAVYAPDGATILTACTSAPGAARLWTAPPELRAEAFTMDEFLLLAEIDPQGQVAVTGAPSDGAFAGWDVKNGRQIWQERLHPGRRVWAASLSGDGRTLLTGVEIPGAGSEVHFWDAGAGNARRAPQRHEQLVRGVVLSPDNQLLVTCSAADGTVRCWDGATLQLVRTLDHPQALHLRLTADQRHLLSGGLDGSARLWETATGKLLQSWPAAALTGAGGRFTPDGAFCVLPHRDGSVRLWDIAAGKPHGQGRIHTASLDSTAAHVDNRSIVTGTRDGRLQRWDVALGKPIGPTVRMDRDVSTLHVARNGTLLIRQHLIPTARAAEMPFALTATLAELRLAVEVLTGKELDEDGSLRDLAQADWTRRRAQLTRLGRDPLRAPPRPL